MPTVFEDNIFYKCELFTVDKSKSILATLRDPVSGRHIPDLLRNDGTGFLTGRLIKPETIPEWLKNGVVFIMNSEDQRFNATLTYQPIAQTRIKGLTEILGDKIKFNYVVTTQYKDV